jgi:hypothetical protein
MAEDHLGPRYARPNRRCPHCVRSGGCSQRSSARGDRPCQDRSSASADSAPPPDLAGHAALAPGRLAPLEGGVRQAVLVALAYSVINVVIQPMIQPMLGALVAFRSACSPGPCWATPTLPTSGRFPLITRGGRTGSCPGARTGHDRGGDAGRRRPRRPLAPAGPPQHTARAPPPARSARALTDPEAGRAGAHPAPAINPDGAPRFGSTTTPARPLHPVGMARGTTRWPAVAGRGRETPAQCRRSGCRHPARECGEPWGRSGSLERPPIGQRMRGERGLVSQR